MQLIKIEDKIVVIKRVDYIVLKQRDWEGKVVGFTIDNNQIRALITALEDMERQVIQETKEKHGER